MVPLIAVSSLQALFTCRMDTLEYHMIYYMIHVTVLYIETKYL
jgi:hypothetical protein